MTLNTHLNKGAALLAALTIAAALAACSSDSGKTTVSGKFEPLADAPAAYAEVAGKATLERADGGTETSISLTGLQPEAGYMAHLHSGSCDETDPGGPHFKFDPDGSEEPPNEIHLAFTSNEAGEGSAQASSDREVPAGEAGSVVLHLADAASMKTHNGEHHDDEGGEHEGGHDDQGGHDHAEEAPDKIACAELEGGSAGTATATATQTVVVENGEPVGGIQELEFSAGDQIAFTVESDVADEVHVHGYDLMEDVPAGGSVEFSFPAEIEGIFEVELEGRGEQIAEVRVNP
jgi:hypothetical protein